MKSRKNLERTIVLGLILSTGISGTAFAKEISGDYNTDRKDPIISNNEDLKITGAIGYNGEISVGENHKLIIDSDNYNAIECDFGNNRDFKITADYIHITAGENGIVTLLEGPKEGNLILGADRNIKGLKIESDGQGIDNKRGSVNINGSNDSIIDIVSQGTTGSESDDQSAINAGRNKNGQITDGTNYIKGGTINLTAHGGSGTLNRTDKSTTIIDATGKITINSETGKYGADQGYQPKTIDNAGINNVSGSTIFTAGQGVDITSNKYGILAQGGEVSVTSTGGKNIIRAAVETVNSTKTKDSSMYGSKHSIKAEGTAKVNVTATADDNVLYGVIYAKDKGTQVTLNHNNTTRANVGTGNNYIYSTAHGTKESEEVDRSNVVAALYAQNQGKIDVIAGEGGSNYIETSYTDLDDSKDSTDSERTVWAQRGGVINIEGTTTIKSSNAEDYYEAGYATNSRGVAITAGSGENLDLADEANGYGYKGKDGKWHAFYEDGVLANAEEVLGYNSEVNLTYDVGSQIYGDVVSGYGGIVNIVKANENSALYMEGNALAANGGELTIELGNGGIWYGRADDYGDAGYGEDAKDKQNYYNPVFSDTIYTGGTVNINMGEGSKWYLTGQSWVSSLDVSQGNGDVTIDMERFNKGTHGLTISELKGNSGGNVDATFVMDLDHNAHNTSDMLYIKNGTGEYDVVLNDVIDGMENINENNVLRFATVQGGASFNSVTMEDQGMYNLGFEIDHSEYDTTDEENKDYNGTSVDTNKPGNDNVEGFFGLGNEEENTSKIMLLDEVDSAADTSIQNWYITKVLGQGLSDAGKTVLNMSRANYSQAVYMDTLNKRLGEARYLEGDEGLWIRMRHDKIDKDSSYEITNNMYELGYDKKYESKDKQGYHRRGVAIDYMDGDTSYDDIAGSGETNRKGIWLYDTWIGNKGHYTDYVAKWGHLENSFDLYTKTRGEKVSGEYDNDVYSLSAEWGYKDQLNNDWYIEPQVQLQYARVTGADYETSQGTQVSVDGIDSLIARAGFRLGKDFGEEKKSTFYVKADVLHEFLGDQDITAIDKTTDGKLVSIGYDNDGTWYSVGLGFSTMLSDSSYAFLDVEKIFGNDNDNSYQINGGFNWLL